jgi:hypothetical protein
LPSVSFRSSFFLECKSIVVYGCLSEKWWATFWKCNSVRNGQIRLAGDKLQLVFVSFLNIALDFCYLCNDLYTRLFGFWRYEHWCTVGSWVQLSLVASIGAIIH